MIYYLEVASAVKMKQLVHIQLALFNLELS